MHVAPISHCLLQPFDVVRGHALGVCQDLRDSLGNSDFVYAQVGVGRDDSTAGEVDTLPRQVTAEATLLSLQSLAETANRLLSHL